MVDSSLEKDKKTNTTLVNKYNTKLRIALWNVSSIKKGTFEEMNNCLAHIICL